VAAGGDLAHGGYAAPAGFESAAVAPPRAASGIVLDDHARAVAEACCAAAAAAVPTAPSQSTLADAIAATTTAKERVSALGDVLADEQVRYEARRSEVQQAYAGTTVVTATPPPPQPPFPTNAACAAPPFPVPPSALLNTAERTCYSAPGACGSAVRGSPDGWKEEDFVGMSVFSLREPSEPSPTLPAPPRDDDVLPQAAATTAATASASGRDAVLPSVEEVPTATSSSAGADSAPAVEED